MEYEASSRPRVALACRFLCEVGTPVLPKQTGSKAGISPSVAQDEMDAEKDGFDSVNTRLRARQLHYIR